MLTGERLVAGGPPFAAAEHEDVIGDPLTPEIRPPFQPALVPCQMLLVADPGRRHAASIFST